jgi:lipoyl(octanoyl) transferase
MQLFRLHLFFDTGFIFLWNHLLRRKHFIVQGNEEAVSIFKYVKISKNYRQYLTLQPMLKKVVLQDIGERHYKEVWDYQENLLKQSVLLKQQEKLPDNYLLFTEHYPVYTLGKNGKIENVLIDENERQNKGVEYFHTNRGGDITFHGNGQLVGYPIFDLDQFKTDLGWYLRSLEEVIILTMADYGLHGQRSAGETGVWLDPHIKGTERKICAMGIRCSRWITMHGFAFNINTDLSFFDYIVPCGIHDKKVTSLEKELGYTIAMDEVKAKVKKNFEKVFDVVFD